MDQERPDLTAVKAIFPRGTDTSCMNPALAFDLDLIRRCDVPGPRYTSYPTAPNFSQAFTVADLKRVARASNDDPIPRKLSLYVHVPFCSSPCFYCGCTRIITRDADRGMRYAERLQREFELWAPLFDRDRDVVQVHFGGGTPNFLTRRVLGDLMHSLGRQFHFSPAASRDFSIEIDPRSVQVDDIAALAEFGFNRASLGVQDFDPEVQAAVNRIQSVEQTEAVVRACRGAGFRSVNIDLIYGLPGQTPERFERTLEQTIALRPDRLAVYSYAHLPELFKAQRQIDAQLLPSNETKLRLLALAVERFSAAGYHYIGMDHFALPTDELSRAQREGSLHRNFMGYTTHTDTDLIGFGVSAISHIGDSFSQHVKELPRYEAAIDRGELPLWRGLSLSSDDVLRADVIQRLMCQGEIDMDAIGRQHGISFEEHFADALARIDALAADGLVTRDAQRLRVTPSGRWLLRVVAMAFDRYLTPAAATRFSKAI